MRHSSIALAPLPAGLVFVAKQLWQGQVPRRDKHAPVKIFITLYFLTEKNLPFVANVVLLPPICK